MAEKKIDIKDVHDDEGIMSDVVLTGANRREILQLVREFYEKQGWTVKDYLILNTEVSPSGIITRTAEKGIYDYIIEKEENKGVIRLTVCLRVAFHAYRDRVKIDRYRINNIKCSEAPDIFLVWIPEQGRFIELASDFFNPDGDSKNRNRKEDIGPMAKDVPTKYTREYKGY